MSSDRFDSRVLELVNEERASAGLDPLSIDSQLDEAANLHTDEMVQADLLSHQLPGEAELEDRVSAAGYDGTVVDENVAAGGGTLFTTPEEVVEGWLNSPKHRANILNPEFTELGIGYASSPDENDTLGDTDVYWTQVFGTGGEADTLSVDSQLEQTGQTITDELQQDTTDYRVLNAEEVGELITSANYAPTIEENATSEELIFAISGDQVDKLLDNPEYQEYLSSQDFSLGVDSSVDPSSATYYVAGEFQDSNFVITGAGAASPAVLIPFPAPR